MTTTEKRKAQYRAASKKNRQEKIKNGWKLIWIPPQLVEEVKKLIKQLTRGDTANR